MFLIVVSDNVNKGKLGATDGNISLNLFLDLEIFKPKFRLLYFGIAVWLPKIKIEIIVSDDLVDICVDTIMDVARTGKIGDGKIFISEIEKIIRIRTGDENESAI